MGPSYHAKFQRKTNDPIPRIPTDRWKDGRMDGRMGEWMNRQTLFHRTLVAMTGSPKK